ncbi:DUF2920 family protein [Clostridium sp.]|uniref:DUF2920 family protein n=1 Tax=Clostridium sp. TaxID=1506 RepID=UPI002FC7DA82
MAKSYEVEIDAHSSIYKKDYLENNYKERKLKVYFSTPDNDINEETGVLLLIPGFGANANSKVYKKMRKEFADKYKLVTVQCDYFGWEFMQSDFNDIDIVGGNFNTDNQEIINMYQKKIQSCSSINEVLSIDYDLETKLRFIKNYNEDIEYFCDMGIMQGIDNVLATLFVINTIYSNDYIFNTNKVIIMGQSHGSYLAHMCNYLCQGLYTNILDNSGWVYPKYIYEPRYLHYRPNEKLECEIEQSYYVYKKEFGIDGLALDRMYSDFNNSCRIVCYHGEGDCLVTYDEKKRAIEGISNIILNKVTSNDIGKGIFSSIGHGCGADFLKIFDEYWKENIQINAQVSRGLNFKNLSYILKNHCIVDYSDNMPVFRFN